MAPSSFLFRLPKIGAGGLVFLLCAGCAPRPVAPPTLPPNPNFIISLQTTPTHPRQLDPTQLRVQLHDIKGKPVRDAAVTASLTMPTMDMGKNEVPLKPDKNGFYTGIGRFTMTGDWQVTVNAVRGKDVAQNYFAVSVH